MSSATESSEDAQRDAADDRAVTPPTWVVTLVLVLPLAVMCVALLRFVGEYNPTSDLANNELRVRDVGRHPVLLGPYSRDGWYHLGPTFYYLAAVPYRLLLASPLGMLVVALLINGGALVGMVLIARRRGGTAAMIATAIAGALLVRSLGMGFALSPWNPYVTVLPFGYLIYLTWAMTCGSTRALPMAVGVTTFLVHTHVGYVPLAMPLLITGAATLLARRPAARSPANAWLAAGAVLVVLWLGPLIDQLFERGNLGAVYDYFRDQQASAHTITDALNVLSEQFTGAPTWITGSRAVNAYLREPDSLYNPSIPWLLPVIVAACVVLWRNGPATARRFLVVVAVAVGSGVLAISRTPGPIYYYRTYFTWVLGAATGVLVMWAAASVPAFRRGSARRAVPLAAVGALAALALVNSVGAVGADLPEPGISRVIGDLHSAIVDDLPPGGGEVVIRSSSFTTAGINFGLVRSLEAAGYDARMDPSVDRAGTHRRWSGATPRADYVIAEPDNLAAFLDNPDLRLVAYRFLPRPLDASGHGEREWRLGMPLDREYLEQVVSSDPRTLTGGAVFRVAPDAGG